VPVFPVTSVDEHAEMGSEDKLLGGMSDSSPFLPLFHECRSKGPASLTETASFKQQAVLSLTPSKSRAPDKDKSAARRDLSNVSQAALDLAVVELDKDFPLIEWNNGCEEVGKSLHSDCLLLRCFFAHHHARKLSRHPKNC
jgi:hypothetical protein